MGSFGSSTVESVRRFQDRRGLLVDGCCDGVTWQALVESGYQLGDRLLYFTSPMLRGDDVAELQRQLGNLGFDAGRVDGFLGPQTEKALRDFQRNTALTVDGVCGPDVISELARLGGRGAGTVVASVRELEALRSGPRLLADRRVGVAETGGLEVLAQATARSLQDLGADAITFHHPDGSVLAGNANGFEAQLCVGLTSASRGPAVVAYYATTGFESVGGRLLAEMLTDALGALPYLRLDPPTGLRLPLLRETRMPAVLCQLWPTDSAVRHGPELAEAIAAGIAAWAERPIDA